MAVVDRWSLFKGHFRNKCSNWDFKIVVVVDRWSLFRGGRQLRFDCSAKCDKEIKRFLAQEVALLKVC